MLRLINKTKIKHLLHFGDLKIYIYLYVSLLELKCFSQIHFVVDSKHGIVFCGIVTNRGNLSTSQDTTVYPEE